MNMYLDTRRVGEAGARVLSAPWLDPPLPIPVKSQFDNYFTIITEKVTIKRVMQIHNIMVLIFITCAVINHLFFTLWYMSIMHFFLIVQALFKVNKFQHE